jgi:hypothetical protein
MSSAKTTAAKVYPAKWQGRSRPICVTYEDGERMAWLIGKRFVWPQLHGLDDLSQPPACHLTFYCGVPCRAPYPDDISRQVIELYGAERLRSALRIEAGVPIIHPLTGEVLA